MRFSKRFYTPLILSICACLWASAAQASSGIAFSIENLYAGLGKKNLSAEIVTAEDGTESVNTDFLRFGRETTEWFGVQAYTDLNKNWRLLYGGHLSWVGIPLIKLDGSIAFMLDMPKELPLQPYFFAGATPILALGEDENISPFSMTAQAGIGLDYTWNEALFTSVRINTYLFNPYLDGSVAEEGSNLTDKGLDWVPISFSLSFSTGIMF